MFRCCVHSPHHIFKSLLKKVLFFFLNKTFLQRIFGELLSAFWSSLEVMVWDPPLCSHTVGTNEPISRATTSTPLSLTSSHALSFSLCSHKHDTKKTRSPIVYSPQRTFGSFLDGQDPVCAACLHASSQLVSQWSCASAGSIKTAGISGPARSRCCVYK